MAEDVHQQIKGYASAVSVQVGLPITFRISVNPPQTYTIDVLRLGWYQGLGGRLLASSGPLEGITQAAVPWRGSRNLPVPPS